MKSDEMPCPCTSGLTYADCCELVHENLGSAKEASDVMRARYSAYALGRIPFLHDSLLASERDSFDEDSAKEWAAQADWVGLEILETEKGELQDSVGTVEFKAYFNQDGDAHEHHEIAKFKKVNGAWYFVDGSMPSAVTIVNEGPKVGRNDPCPCGSGKKYKKCCG